MLTISNNHLMAKKTKTKNNKQKMHTIHVKKTNLSIYMNKFQHSALPALLIGERCVKRCKHLTFSYS